MGGNHPVLVPPKSQNDAGNNTRHKIHQGLEKPRMPIEKMIEKRPTRRHNGGYAPHLGGPSTKGLADCFVVLHRIAGSSELETLVLVSPHSPPPLGVGLARI